MKNAFLLASRTCVRELSAYALSFFYLKEISLLITSTCISETMSIPIPQPPGVPLLGNIFDVDPNNTWTSLNRLAEKYGK
jgi:hypothetical protein